MMGFAVYLVEAANHPCKCSSRHNWLLQAAIALFPRENCRPRPHLLVTASGELSIAMQGTCSVAFQLEMVQKVHIFKKSNEDTLQAETQHMDGQRKGGVGILRDD